MSTHTPGPWHRNISADGKYPTVFAGRNQHVAVASQQKDSAETEANISLIAAAPDLLAALQRAAALLARYPDHTDAWRECRAAIARATGEA
jgi:histidinol-phosphate/aromatic aminotransferase/cobyric acid decarboxylase-like protein